VQDLPLACLVAGALTFILVFVTSSIATEHTCVHLPRLLVGDLPSPRRRRSLLIELPWAIVILGGGEVVMVLFLLHPNSSLPVRLVSAAQLIAATCWFLFLARRIARSKGQPPAEQ
jgi:hypothetical protein